MKKWRQDCHSDHHLELRVGWPLKREHERTPTDGSYHVGVPMYFTTSPSNSMLIVICGTDEAGVSSAYESDRPTLRTIHRYKQS